jgi:exopolyphosphatase/guanosine-5'-triphosphate,3'-diphosphate pyrophosphatase
MRVSHVTVLATAAARDAENGKDFLQAAAAACGYPIELLTGEREAALSAQGIISGFHEPDGVVGDLGGGSLELMDVAGRVTSSGVTLPLGGLTLRDLSASSTKKAQKIARDALARAVPLAALEGRTFYAIGGTWRALARLQMIERDYPLRVMHSYDLAVPEGGFLALVERLGLGNGVKAMEQVAEARRPLLAYGALVLDEIVRAGQAGAAAHLGSRSP